MQLRQSCYRSDKGWAAPLPADLDGPRTLVLAFGASAFADDTRPFVELKTAFPRSIVAGCSTAGEIAGASIRDGSVSVVVARFEHTRLMAAQTQVAHPEDSHAAGERLADQLDKEGLRAVFILSDGLRVNGTALVAGMTGRLPAGTPLTGGLAGDGQAFTRTWILADGMPAHGMVAAIGLYGDRLRVGSGCSGGWADFGPQRRVTRSKGNVLLELDGKPALDLYKEYLGEMAAGLPGNALLFPLSIRKPGSPAQPLVRTILAIDEEQRSMTFAGDIPQGHEARLMRASDDKLIGSAATAMATAAEGLDARGPALVVSVSCVGRRLMLGERTEEEIEALAESSPADATHVGFYSYGEIAPALEGGVCDLHNQTMTVTVFAEA